MRIKVKAADNERKTYEDQRMVELYDYYDLEAGEAVPKMLTEARLKKEGKRTVVVGLDYQVKNGFSLNGKKGQTSFYEDAGKKAYVRGGYYKHPYKDYEVFIEMMEPIEYIELCAKMFSKRGEHITALELVSGREKDYDLEEVFGNSEGDIFYPAINYISNGQEGIHRAMWAMDRGYKEIPVIIIK